MIGPVAKTDAAAARAGGQVFRTLPPQIQVAVLVLAVLAGMVGCSVAWIDQQSYTPSPKMCRRDQVPQAVQLGCIPPQQLPAPTGWQR
ncbi:hypothetical protein [Nocardia altamirensis]|uniref:hypothetical protein n=1 Tax=Nocardia altamirensis TaxID=472158 RepID=UPI00084093B6|nr:hypothetical protein [Nocardia altamirensis]